MDKLCQSLDAPLAERHVIMAGYFDEVGCYGRPVHHDAFQIHKADLWMLNGILHQVVERYIAPG
jgi:hypothetical protein